MLPMVVARLVERTRPTMFANSAAMMFTPQKQKHNDNTVKRQRNLNVPLAEDNGKHTDLKTLRKRAATFLQSILQQKTFTSTITHLPIKIDRGKNKMKRTAFSSKCQPNPHRTPTCRSRTPAIWHQTGHRNRYQSQPGRPCTVQTSKTVHNYKI